jgi:DNA-binding transcriptional ArsR family regulator
MNDELKLLAKKLSAVFAVNPTATRAALAEAMPQAVNALAALARSKEATVSARMKAIRELLALQRRIVSEDLRRDTVALKRREAECRIIEARVAGIKAKTEQAAESRKHRADVQRALRTIAAAKKVTNGAS